SALILAEEISRAEDIVEVGRGFIAFHDALHERQGAVGIVDRSALAQHGAIRLVAVDHGILDVYRAIEGIAPTAQGRRAIRLVGVDRTANQRQNTVFTVVPTAQSGIR